MSIRAHALLRFNLLVASLGLVAAAVGCAKPSLPVWSHDDPADHHVVAVDERGRSVYPAAWPKPHPTTREYDHQLDGMMKAMDAWWTDYSARHPVNEGRRVLIFVHGGLTPPESSLTRSAARTAEIEEAGYFPIFIVWNPELWSSYREHLAYVRRGRYEEDSDLLGPFYFLADLGRAITRTPVVWTFQADNDFKRIRAGASAIYHSGVNRRWLDNPQFANAVAVTAALTTEYHEHAPSAIPTSLGPVKGKALDPFLHNVWFFASVVPRMFLTPSLDAGGMAAWDNMYRRASILFDGFTTSNLRLPSTQPATFIHPGPGAVVRLIEELHKKQEAEGWKITLVGHSMGSIVLNELVRRCDQLHDGAHRTDGDERFRLKFDNIVYLAAACSVRDFQRTVVPYMQHNPDTQFYNLSLHPVNEIRENSFYELAPRGSLLVWIDDMFSTARTPLDRTLGRWENIVETVYILPDDVRPRIHLKGFGAYVNVANVDQNPQEHGDFSGLRYWDPHFWEVTPRDRVLGDIPDVLEKANDLSIQVQLHPPSTQTAE